MIQSDELVQSQGNAYQLNVDITQLANEWYANLRSKSSIRSKYKKLTVVEIYTKLIINKEPHKYSR